MFNIMFPTHFLVLIWFLSLLGVGNSFWEFRFRSGVGEFDSSDPDYDKSIIGSGGVPGIRGDACSVSLSNSSVLVFGGSYTLNGFYYEYWIYNYDANKWSVEYGSLNESNTNTSYGSFNSFGTGSNTPGSRSGMNCWFTTSTLILFSGSRGDHYFDDVWVYSLTEKKWKWRGGFQSTYTGYAQPRSRHHYTLIGPTNFSQKFFGGCRFDTYLNDLWSYSHITDTWTPLSHANRTDDRGVYEGHQYPSARSEALSWRFDTSTYMYGGRYKENALSDLWMYNETTTLWGLVYGSNVTESVYYGSVDSYGVANKPGMRRGMSGVSFSKDGGILMMFGGYSDSMLHNDVWVYSVESNEWKYVVNGGMYPYKKDVFLEDISPTSMTGMSAWKVGERSMIIFGGFTESFVEPSSNQLWEIKYVYRCDGVLEGYPGVCNNRGKCSGNDYCDCNPFYYSKYCTVAVCNHIRSDKGDVCNGNGVCKSHDYCLCNDTHGGDFCDTYKCNGVLHTSKKVCSGKGKCKDIDKCKCDFVNYGKDCENSNLWLYAGVIPGSIIFGIVLIVFLVSSGIFGFVKFKQNFHIIDDKKFTMAKDGISLEDIEIRDQVIKKLEKKGEKVDKLTNRVKSQKVEIRNLKKTLRQSQMALMNLKKLKGLIDDDEKVDVSLKSMGDFDVDTEKEDLTPPERRESLQPEALQNLDIPDEKPEQIESKEEKVPDEKPEFPPEAFDTEEPDEKEKVPDEKPEQTESTEEKDDFPPEAFDTEEPDEKEKVPDEKPEQTEITEEKDN